MSINSDCSAFIEADELTLAQSKTQPYFRAGEVYALRGRLNGNPCGPFGPCMYLFVFAVPCRPCLVEIRFGVYETDHIVTQTPLYYDNSTGAFQQDLAGTPEDVTAKGFNNRLTAINGEQLVKATTVTEVISSLEWGLFSKK